MRLDGNQARASRAAARREPIEYVIGDTSIAFKAEMPLDVLFGVEQAYVSDMRGLHMWLLAHVVVSPLCDTSCVEGTREESLECKALPDFRGRLRRIRVDGEALIESDFDDMWKAVRDAQGVTEGESSSSAESSETAGDTSSVTSSDSVSTPPSSGKKPRAASVA